MDFDLVIRNGRVFDGEEFFPLRVDIGILGDKVAAIGELGGSSANTELHAEGHVVAPGFIDAHTHSDLNAYQLDRDFAGASVQQGVTTEICGNCGFSPFPYLEGHEDELKRHIKVLLGMELVWPDFERYGAEVEETGLLANLAPLVGHGSLRAGVIGLDPRAVTRNELRAMAQVAAKTLEQGCIGMSTGLVYAPGVFSSTDELVELCGTIKSDMGVYASHIRGETDTVVQAVAEAIEIGRRADIPVHISHHKAAGRRNWGATEKTLELIEEARQNGIDLTLDVYPYTSASTLLYSLLPSWVQEGGLPPLLERLEGWAIREQIKKDIEQGIPGWENMPGAVGWENVVIASCRGQEALNGSSIRDLAEKSCLDCVDYVAKLLAQQQGNVIVILHAMSEDDLANVLTFEGTLIGSDGIALPGKPHPRIAGTFPRVLGRYCREQGVLPMEVALRRMTSLAASRFRLQDRGYIRAGAFADLVIFDPDEILDGATFEKPLSPPAGIAQVIVNGQVTVSDGVLTGTGAGRVEPPGV